MIDQLFALPHHSDSELHTKYPHSLYPHHLSYTGGIDRPHDCEQLARPPYGQRSVARDAYCGRPRQPGGP